MDTIIVYTDRSNLDDPFEYEIEFSHKCDYRLFSPDDDFRHRIYKGDTLVARVYYTDIIIDGKRIPFQKNTRNMILSNDPEVILCTDGWGWKFFIDNTLVASISYPGHLLEWIGDMIREWRLLKFDPQIKIEYDRSRLSTFHALCLLATRISRD